MSLTSHLNELRRKHEILSTRIEQEQRHPSADDLAIASLKKEKLKLKEQISRMSGDLH
ncbi:MAG: YdcH family protein [Rubrimonas sp.]|uniref:YdcH family protein n=1 Tax=Rubrimonas sp. TaxID=2036015 RepID=UPI002FDDDFCD